MTLANSLLNNIKYLRQSYLDKKFGKKSTGRISYTYPKVQNISLNMNRIYDFISALAREIIAICIANHHGSLMDAMSPYGDTPFHERMKPIKTHSIILEALRNALKENINNDISEFLKRFGNEIEDYIKRCKSKNLNTAFMIHFLTKSIFSCLIDADRFNAYCFEINEVPGHAIKLPPWEEYANRLEQKISTFKGNSEINRIRRSISEYCLSSASLPKGVYRLDVPTGGGKTLSSLRFALNHQKIHGAEHIIYVLPYLSVLEQTADEIKKALQFQPGDYFILEHHSNFIVNDSEDSQIHKLLTSRWDSAIIITQWCNSLKAFTHVGAVICGNCIIWQTQFFFDECNRCQSNVYICLMRQSTTFTIALVPQFALYGNSTSLNKTERPIQLPVIKSLVPI